MNEITDKGEATKFLVTENMIREVRDYVIRKGYPKPEVEFWRLTDQKDNIKAFKNKLPVVAGSYKRNNRTFTITGCQNVAAYELYNSGTLVFVSPHTEFEVPNGVELNGNVVVRAVSATGEKIMLSPNRD